jgi:hypothetical protein
MTTTSSERPTLSALDWAPYLARALEWVYIEHTLERCPWDRAYRRVAHRWQKEADRLRFAGRPVTTTPRRKHATYPTL